ncbi:MAG: PhzF family phenazine biosynthesis protein, partial [Rhodospirillales bacterium]|nr:PhzF family phenazine biosynthesis protein [Rhodospirillales bacterium]
PPAPCAPCAGLIEALGGTPEAVLAARDYVVVYGNEDEVRALTPDMAGLMALDRFAVIATAPGRDCDFVSRFFAPAKGVPEDPVTGSAHCSLVPYWAARLGKDALDARQVSARGGAIRCRNDGDRVHLAGKAVLYLEGSVIFIS